MNLNDANEIKDAFGGRYDNLYQYETVHILIINKILIKKIAVVIDNIHVIFCLID